VTGGKSPRAQINCRMVNAAPLGEQSPGAGERIDCRFRDRYRP